MSNHRDGGRRASNRFSFFVSIAAVAWSAASGAFASDAPVAKGRTVVVWLSFDGVRPDYIERARTPTFDRLIREGAYSGAHEPVFPSLTFPSHVSQSTGVTVARHGIPGNSYYDAADGQTRVYPAEAALLCAEPIWVTAERQGVRTAVYDWPVSHSQTGEVCASYFGTGYDSRLSDDVRLAQVLDAWRSDHNEKPLQLLMGYAVGADRAGHAHGPDSAEVVFAMEEADAALARFLEAALAHWETAMTPDDTLYVVISSDHGMSAVHTMVNPHRLLGVEGRNDVTIVSSGNVANVFLDTIEPESARRALVAQMKQAAAAHGFAHTYARGESPEQWGYEHATRTGDLNVVLDNGYVFSRRPRVVAAPVAEHDGPQGMHGYDPATNPEMNTIAIFWRHPEPLGGVELGPTHALQLHPTVARLLGVLPAPHATATPIELEAVGAAATP